MLSNFARLVRDQRGTTLEGIALSVAIMAVAFVASADMLDRVLKKHLDAQQSVGVASANAVPATMAGNLDMAPTASLPRLVSHSVLDPCTGLVK